MRLIQSRVVLKTILTSLLLAACMPEEPKGDDSAPPPKAGTQIGTGTSSGTPFPNATATPTPFVAPTCSSYTAVDCSSRGCEFQNNTCVIAGPFTGNCGVYSDQQSCAKYAANGCLWNATGGQPLPNGLQQNTMPYGGQPGITPTPTPFTGAPTTSTGTCSQNQNGQPWQNNQLVPYQQQPRFNSLAAIGAAMQCVGGSVNCGGGIVGMLGNVITAGSASQIYMNNFPQGGGFMQPGGMGMFSGQGMWGQSGMYNGQQGMYNGQYDNGQQGMNNGQYDNGQQGMNNGPYYNGQPGMYNGQYNGQPGMMGQNGRYTYDPNTQRYRDNQTGQYVDSQTVRMYGGMNGMGGGNCSSPSMTWDVSTGYCRDQDNNYYDQNGNRIYR